MIVNATVRALPDDEVNHGHCYSSIAGLAGGDLVHIRSEHAAIYCRVAWDIINRLDSPNEVALDHWQCSALSCTGGMPVQVTAQRISDVPSAEFLELQLLRGVDGLFERAPGLQEFLGRGHYPLYPGLQFAYRPLAVATAGEYRVVRVRAGGADVEVAQVDGALEHVIRRSPALRAIMPTYEDLGGLDDVVALLRREIEVPLRRTADLRQIGVHASVGVLLYGPPGIGKTSLARAVGAHCDADVVLLSGPALVTQPRADAESALREAFHPVPGGSRPLLVILDDLDYLTPSRDSPGAAGSFLGLMQELLDRPDRPVVIATTSRPDDIDLAIRRLGRVGRQIPLPLPADEDRRAILAIHTRDLALAVDDEAGRSALLNNLAARTSGFVGADLAALCHEAGRIALRRAFPLELLEADRLQPVTPLEITETDWSEALTFVTPSVIGGIVPELPRTTFADVAGLDSTIEELRERLVLPLQNPQLFAAAGLRIERGVLLYGPPGTGKTLLARALANECGQRFLSVRGPELLNRWFGESERAVRDLFEKARHLAPSILFFDEVDALVPRRTGGATDGGAADRVVNQLLAELDGLQDLGNITVIGATNNPDNIDRAVLRPGRLGLHIEVGLPDPAGRHALFSLYLPEPEVAEQIPEYVGLSEHMSGADIAMVAREARLAALRRGGFQRFVALDHADVIAGLRLVRESSFGR